jgi:hypothetical protein
MARAQALVPALAELIENHDPALEGLDFNQIEASAAAIGDVVSRLLMKGAVEQRPVATKQEVEAAFERARQKAGRPASEPASAEERRVMRGRRKRRLKTMRGPVEIEREYLYFPALGTGIFPPRSKTQSACR